MNIKHLEIAVCIACMSILSRRATSLAGAVAVARRTPWGRNVPAPSILAGIRRDTEASGPAAREIVNHAQHWAEGEVR